MHRQRFEKKCVYSAEDPFSAHLCCVYSGGCVQHKYGKKVSWRAIDLLREGIRLPGRTFISYNHKIKAR